MDARLIEDQFVKRDDFEAAKELLDAIGVHYGMSGYRLRFEHKSKRGDLITVELNCHQILRTPDGKRYYVRQDHNQVKFNLSSDLHLTGKGRSAAYTEVKELLLGLLA